MKKLIQLTHSTLLKHFIENNLDTSPMHEIMHSLNHNDFVFKTANPKILVIVPYKNKDMKIPDGTIIKLEKNNLKF